MLVNMVGLYIFFIIVFVLVSLLTCTLVLAQESKSTGMGSAFGAESASQVLGSSSAAILKKITAYFILAFLLVSLLLSVWTGSFSRKAQHAAAQHQVSDLQEDSFDSSTEQE